MLAAHADWSIAPAKRFYCTATGGPGAWALSAPRLVGDAGRFLDRLIAEADGGAVVLGVDCPIGLPREYAAKYAGQISDFVAFLRTLGVEERFFDVCATLDDLSPARPFYPARGVKGMTRLAHARALGLSDAAALGRACDRATRLRPAGAPLFWTLGANQSGKAAISAWRDMLIPALCGSAPPVIWPFDGTLRALLAPGRAVIAETYPAEALRQLGLVLRGSKRRQSDRQRLAPALRVAIGAATAAADADLVAAIDDGFGALADGEDRLDCLLGVLCVMAVLDGRRPDIVPDDPWITRWEGWVLGQTELPLVAPLAPVPPLAD